MIGGTVENVGHYGATPKEEKQQESDTSILVVQGVIVRRRCHGRHLSFVTVSSSSASRRTKVYDEKETYTTVVGNDNEPNDSTPNLIQAAFRRAHFDDDLDKDSCHVNDQNEIHNKSDSRRQRLPFPVKSSDLPYGANIELHVVNTGTDEALSNSDSLPRKSSQQWQVHSWFLIGEHPRTQAMQSAAVCDKVPSIPHSDTVTAPTAISCTQYFKARGDLFRKVAAPHHHEAPIRCSIKQNQTSHNKAQNQDESMAHKDTSPREAIIPADPHAKGGNGQRARVFAEWLVQNLPVLRSKDQETNTASTATVLDVAGGKGSLSVELAKFGILATVVDPLVRSQRSLRKLDKSRRRRNQPSQQKDLSGVSTGQESDSSLPTFVAAYFERDQATREMVAHYDCLVGLHPDECTETIVDMALQYNKYLAVVPCCVFPSLFPQRQLQGGQPVQSYDDFIKYLLQKDKRLQRATLPIPGKNQVIFLPVKS